MKEYTRGSGSRGTRRKWVLSMEFVRGIRQEDVWEAVDLGDVVALHILISAFVRIRLVGRGFHRLGMGGMAIGLLGHIKQNDRFSHRCY